LRAYDAVQLATALAVRAADPGVKEFVAFDRGLCEAAGVEGFVVTP
jgi:predicted nucleic acid-binding protein